MNVKSLFLDFNLPEGHQAIFEGVRCINNQLILSIKVENIQNRGLSDYDILNPTNFNTYRPNQRQHINHSNLATTINNLSRLLSSNVEQSTPMVISSNISRSNNRPQESTLNVTRVPENSLSDSDDEKKLSQMFANAFIEESLRRNASERKNIVHEPKQFFFPERERKDFNPRDVEKLILENKTFLATRAKEEKKDLYDEYIAVCVTLDKFLIKLIRSNDPELSAFGRQIDDTFGVLGLKFMRILDSTNLAMLLSLLAAPFPNETEDEKNERIELASIVTKLSESNQSELLNLFNRPNCYCQTCLL